MSGSVAVIGVGAMGGPMASRLHEAGFDVTVCDRDEAALSRFDAAGIETVKEPSRCAGAEVVLVLVATPQQVRDVVAGESGIASGLFAARPPLVVVMSTVPAETVTELHEALLPSGVRVIDAPISGGVVRAARGTLSVMVGGEAADLEKIRPVLSAFASQVFHCGPVGSGETLKIVNNIIGTTSAMVMAEACRLALERGLDLDDTIRVLEASSGRTYLTADQGEAAEFYSQITRTRQGFDSLAAIMRKDFGLAVQLAGDVQGSYPLVERLKEFADVMGDETFENWHTVGTAPPGAGVEAP
jgi:3-hydroxyisobutyrate dehydrogenase-like beta-hydroxyacid dehydrogenase